MVGRALQPSCWAGRCWQASVEWADDLLAPGSDGEYMLERMNVQLCKVLTLASAIHSFKRHQSRHLTGRPSSNIIHRGDVRD